MKAVSLSLKIIAILAAAFSIYSWMDIRCKISTAKGHMKDVTGVTLAEKSSKVPGFLVTISDQKDQIEGLKSRGQTLEKRIQSTTTELESERAKSVKANAEIVKKNSDIRTLTASVETFKKQIAEKDSLVETLKREIVSTKALLTDTSEVDSLKEKVGSLESQLATKSEALTKAEDKVKELESAEVVSVTETDALGNKVVKKVVKIPYTPTGDMATVLTAKPNDSIVVINRGQANGVKAMQSINLKNEGKVVAEIVIAESYDNFALAYINPKVGIPETLEVGDVLEMDKAAE